MKKKRDHLRGLYETWVADHMNDLHRMAYRLSGTSATAEDLVQETFYHAWRSINSLKDTAKARPWLFRILRFRYAHWVRDQTRRPRTTSLAQCPIEPIEANIGRHTVDVMADRELLQRALDELDDPFKLPFLMVFLQGMTCRETAQELDIPLGTVLSRIHRAKQFLKNQLHTIDERPHQSNAKDRQTQTQEGTKNQLRLRS